MIRSHLERTNEAQDRTSDSNEAGSRNNDNPGRAGIHCRKGSQIAGATVGANNLGSGAGCDHVTPSLPPG
jgi:hypothetical protein